MNNHIDFCKHTNGTSRVGTCMDCGIDLDLVELVDEAVEFLAAEGMSEQEAIEHIKNAAKDSGADCLWCGLRHETENCAEWEAANVKGKFNNGRTA